MRSVARVSNARSSGSTSEGLSASAGASRASILLVPGSILLGASSGLLAGASPLLDPETGTGSGSTSGGNTYGNGVRGKTKVPTEIVRRARKTRSGESDGPAGAAPTLVLAGRRASHSFLAGTLRTVQSSRSRSLGLRGGEDSRTGTKDVWNWPWKVRVAGVGAGPACDAGAGGAGGCCCWAGRGG